MENLRSEMLRLEHGHGNDQWHRMEEVRDPDQRDEEREWSRHPIFRCTACEDEIRVEMPRPGLDR